YFLVELERIIARLGTKHSSSSPEQRVLDISRACSSGTFLLFKLLGRATDFLALLRLMCSLTLVGQVALHVEIDSVVVGLDAEHGVGKRYLPARVFTTVFYN